ncbi:MAG: TRAP transporter substrate-binding protein [Pseudomonadota bacterium]
MLTRPTLRAGAAALALMGLSLATPAAAQTVWDVSIPWGPTEFHTQNAQKFAERVKEETGGSVEMTIHPGGALGIRANESLRAVEDGAVPMAEYAAFQNVGELPILGIESIPFLIDDYGDLRKMHEAVRPVWEAELAKRNQKALYIVPWPSQNFFTKTPIAGPDDFDGVRMRTYDKNTAEMVSRLGMVPLQMNNVDIVPALASGKLDAVMTSGSTAVAQKYWEFLNHVYNTNHLWASNIMAVNMDEWNALSEEDRATIERIAAEMEPDFWAVSEGEHGKRMEELKAEGMTVDAPSAETVAAMKEATADMADTYAQDTAGAADALAAYRAATGR